MFQTLAILMCLLLLLHLALRKKIRPKPGRRPPGPGILETLYHFLVLRKDVQLVTSNWAERYGELFTLQFFGLSAVFVNTLRAGKAIFGSSAGAGRFKAVNFETISGGAGFGIVNADGKPWSEARKQALSFLSQYGFGKRDSESIILTEADSLCLWIMKEVVGGRSSSTGIKLHNLHVPVKLFSSSSIWQMIASKRLTPESKEIYDLMNHFLNAIRKSSARGLVFFPWLRFVLPEWTYYQDCKDRSEAIHTFVGEEFDKHRDTYQEGKFRDLMDSYVKHLSETSDPESVFYGKLGYKTAVSSMVDMLVATWDTVNESICFALCYIAAHPKVMRKLQEEIDRVLGREQPPTGEHKNCMPYMQATIDESFRMSSVAPWGMPHEAMDDINYGPYTITKGTILVCNTHHIHHDKGVWGDPENFRPERFLNGEGGKQLKKYVVPFMPGRRTCLGAPLTMDTIFFFLTRLLQKFEIHRDPATPKERYMEMETDMLLGQFPKNVDIIFKLRT